MQVIIPLAGKGTRLRPHTHLVPKPLLEVAGRPVLDWVMDTLTQVPGGVGELIFITGHLKAQVEDYTRGRYGVPCHYLEQQVQDGTAGAVHLARPLVTGPVLIVFVDTVFEADLSIIGADRRRVHPVTSSVWPCVTPITATAAMVPADITGVSCKEGEVAAGVFEAVAARRFVWHARHTSAEWVEQLVTHSDHALLPDERRTRLLAAVGDAITRLGGSLLVHYETRLVTAVTP